eukprot:378445-Rhodomonas_salina.3
MPQVLSATRAGLRQREVKMKTHEVSTGKSSTCKQTKSQSTVFQEFLPCVKRIANPQLRTIPRVKEVGLLAGMNSARKLWTRQEV